MSYETFRVEITRDETRDEGAVTIEVTAYFDRVPETDIPTRGMLTRAAKGVWNSRLQFTGDKRPPIHDGDFDWAVYIQGGFNVPYCHGDPPLQTVPPV